MNALLDVKMVNSRIVGTAKQGEEVVTIDSSVSDQDSLTWTI
ncbi:hypothetical protein AAIB49_10640 [Ornithinibacillus sp. JPR2-1]